MTFFSYMASAKVGYDFCPKWKASVGYDYMSGDDGTSDKVKGGYHKSWQDWCWMQLNINPRVLFTKW